MTAELVPVRTEAPRFEDIVETYLARDYIKAGKFAESLVHEAGAIQGFLLSLSGLCRSGNARRAQQPPKSQAAVCDRTTHGALI